MSSSHLDSSDDSDDSDDSESVSSVSSWPVESHNTNFTPIKCPQISPHCSHVIRIFFPSSFGNPCVVLLPHSHFLDPRTAKMVMGLPSGCVNRDSTG